MKTISIGRHREQCSVQHIIFECSKSSPDKMLYDASSITTGTKVDRSGLLVRTEGFERNHQHKFHGPVKCFFIRRFGYLFRNIPAMQHTVHANSDATHGLRRKMFAADRKQLAINRVSILVDKQ